MLSTPLIKNAIRIIFFSKFQLSSCNYLLCVLLSHYIIFQILCGDDEVFIEYRDLCESWYCMLVSRSLYQHPTIKATDLQYQTQVKDLSL